MRLVVRCPVCSPVIAIPVPLCVSAFTASDNISCLGEHSGVLVHHVTARIGRQGRQVRVLPDAIAE